MSQIGAYEIKDDSISELELVQRALRTESNTSIQPGSEQLQMISSVSHDSVPVQSLTNNTECWGWDSAFEIRENNVHKKQMCE